MSINFNDFVNMPLPGADDQQGEVIGGFAPPRPQPQPAAPAGGDPNRLTPATERRQPMPRGSERDSTYYAGAEYDELRALTTEDRVRLQQQLVALGLANNVVYGELDDGTLGAFRSVLAMANRSGEDWRATLGRIATNPQLQEQAGGLIGSDQQPYMAPDYASIAQEVKGVFRNRLGREPDQAEMAELVGEIQGWDRQAHDVALASSQPELGPDGLPSGPAQGGQQVDPLARFQEEFDRRYSGELDFIEDKESNTEARQSVEQSTNLASSMARGNY